MRRQPVWDQYEVALLVSAYIRITEDGENKKEVLKELSETLRSRALNSGIDIDDTFRNLNGMAWQMGFIECAFNNTGYGKHMPSKLFQNVVYMYQNQPEEFKRIYETAISQSERKIKKSDCKEIEVDMSERKTAFLVWLDDNPKTRNKKQYIVEAFETASAYATSHRISKKALWDIDSKFELKQYFEKLRKDKIFRVLQKEASLIVFRNDELYLDFWNCSACPFEEEDKEKNFEEAIVNIVAEKFVYGYRLESVIERLKLRQYLSEAGIEFEGSDDELEEMLLKKGTMRNGKLVIESQDETEKLNSEIEVLFSEGTVVFYYETFFENKYELMEELHITSGDMLKDVLKEKRTDLMISKNYFSFGEKVTEDIAVTNEIMRVWGNEVALSVDELSGRLSFIPAEKIRFYLSQSQFFVWVSEGIYTRLDLIKINEIEEREIKDFTANEIARKGYLSLSDLPLSSVLEENYELSEYSVLMGTFYKCLADCYSLHGRIITENNSEYDATTLMRQFCDELEEITLDDAILKVEEFTGVADRRVAYPVLFDSMIRVDEQRFIAENKVRFDVDKIDDQIERFAKDGFVALKEITTFALFPECGCPWNHFVLESYCYRFSRKYTYRTNLFNAKNAGAILDKAITWDYQELMAQAVARSQIELVDDSIGKFLYDIGYMARSKFGGLHDIAKRAEIIREEKA